MPVIARLGPGQVQEPGTQSWFPQMGGREPSNESSQLPPSMTLTGNWNWKQSQDSNSGTPIWNVAIATTMANSVSAFHIFHKLFFTCLFTWHHLIGTGVLLLPSQVPSLSYPSPHPPVLQWMSFVNLHKSIMLPLRCLPMMQSILVLHA